MKQQYFIVSILLVALLLNQQTILSQTIDTTDQTPVNTHKCLPGHYWNQQYCIKCRNPPSNGYCDCTCPGTCTAINCNSGYISNGDKANPTCTVISTTPCNFKGCKTDKCTTINNAQACLECTSSHVLLGYVCIPRGNCKEFNKATGQCLQCDDGFYRNFDAINNQLSNALFTDWGTYPDYFEDQCSTPCNADMNCKTCNSGTTCSTCKDAYYWDIKDNKCKTCGTGCVQCNDENQCMMCDQSGSFKYFRKPVGQYGWKCVKCNDENEGQTNCKECMHNLILGATKAFCTLCDSSYFIDMDGSCKQCGPNCKYCQSDKHCTTCSPPTSLNGFYVVTTAGLSSCATCSNNCLTCTSGTVCTKCMDGYFILNNACSQCESKCSICTGLTACTVCKPNNILSNTRGVCGPPMTGCIAGHKDTVTPLTSPADPIWTCDSCGDKYYLESPSKICTLCSAIPASNILRCDNNKVPKQCAENYFLLAGTPPKCVPTIANNKCCDYSDENGKCNTCTSPQIIYQGACIDCPDTLCKTGCAKTVSASTCTTCLTADQHFLKDSVCYACTDTSGTVGGIAKCLTCAFADSKVTCIKCMDTFKKVITGNVETCEACTDATYCLTCDTNKNSCDKCKEPESFRLGDNTCKVCTDYSANCIKCSATQCTHCATGYYLSTRLDSAGATEYKCFACPTGCATCVHPGNVCLTCSVGHVKVTTNNIIECVQLEFIDGANTYLSKCVNEATVQDECTLCKYGFYKNGQICHQCVNPYSGFVCGMMD